MPENGGHAAQDGQVQAFSIGGGAGCRNQEWQPGCRQGPFQTIEDEHDREILLAEHPAHVRRTDVATSQLADIDTGNLPRRMNPNGSEPIR